MFVPALVLLTSVAVEGEGSLEVTAADTDLGLIHTHTPKGAQVTRGLPRQPFLEGRPGQKGEVHARFVLIHGRPVTNILFLPKLGLQTTIQCRAVSVGP